MTEQRPTTIKQRSRWSMEMFILARADEMPILEPRPRKRESEDSE